MNDLRINFRWSFLNWLFLTAIFLFLPQPVAAQEADPYALSAIRAQAAGLLAENSQLKAEYTDLNQQYVELKQKIEQYQQEMQAMDSQKKETAEKHVNQKSSLQELKKELEKATAELQTKKIQNSLLNHKVAGGDPTARIRQLKAEELEYQIKELDMELKVKSVHYEKSKAEHEASRRKIEKIIAKNRAAAAEWEEREKLIATEGPLAEEKLRALQREKKIAAAQANIFHSDKALLEKEIALLEEKKVLADKSWTGALAGKEERNAKLTRDVEQLRGEIKTIDDSLQQAMAQHQDQRGAMGQMIQLDQENQQLRGRIENLQQEINLLLKR
ncbi:MAG: hypothetical protein HQL23_07350 [Candidatus Omnitrophica bacterium]|nr:hypothetical protein [Candidatus Omnitrophota bacterium]